MTCTDAQLLINRLLDSEINDADAATLFSHLSGCPDCRLVYRESIKIQSTIRALAVRTMTAAGSDARQSTLDMGQSRRPAWISQIAIAAAAIALVVIGVLGTLAVTRFEQRIEQPEATRVLWILPEHEITPTSNWR